MDQKQPVGQIIKEWADISDLKAEYIEKIESTSDYAKKSRSHLIITDEQTKGRGRGQNKWICSGYGDSIATTWIFVVSQAVQPILAPLVGLVLYKALLKTWPLQKVLSLKSPNDIYLKDGKLAGILIEIIQQGKETKIFIGIGINIFSSPQLPFAGLKATHLSAEVCKVHKQDIMHFLSSLKQGLDFALSQSFVCQLALSQREEIKNALNKYCAFNSKSPYYQAVLIDGSLKTSTGIVAWQDIPCFIERSYR